MDLRAEGDGRPVLACRGCKLAVRLLTRYPGDPTPGFEPRPAGTSAYAYDAPPAGSWWVGMIRQSDQVWRPVALAQEHGRCWDALLTYPGEGDRLTVPTDAPPGVSKAGENGTAKERTTS
jgi:hypothetical protein